MAKTQPAAAPVKAGITLQRVIGAAFTVLDRDGIAKLSTRAIAAELGVQTNTVMWHIQNKERLLELMADAIMGEIDLDRLPDAPAEQAAELFQRLRRAMLGHRDGGSIVAGTFPVEAHTLAFADRTVTTLFACCPTRKSAAWTSFTLLYFTLGLVQEQQATPVEFRGRLRESVDQQRFPGLSSVLADYVSIDYDERFAFGVDQILRSALVAEDAP